MKTIAFALVAVALAVGAARADVAVADYEGFLDTNYRTVFPNTHLADLTSFSGEMLGNFIFSECTNRAGQVSRIGYPAEGYCLKTDAEGAITVQYQVKHAGMIKCVYVQFAQDGADVKARAVRGCYAYVTLGDDLDDRPDYKLACTAYQDGYGICRVSARRLGRDRVFAAGYLATTNRTLWNPGTLANLGDWRGVMAGKFLQRPSRGFDGELATNFGARAEVGLQTYCYNVATPADSYTRIASLSLTQDLAQVKGRLNAVLYKGGYHVGENMAWSSYEAKNIGASDTNDVAVRDVSAGRLHARVFTHPGYVTASRTVFWSGVALADVVAVDGFVSGPWITPKHVPPTALYGFSNDGSQLSVQFQLQDGKTLKGVKLVLEQSGDDVVGYAAYARYKSAGTAGETDLDSGATDYAVATSDTVGNYGICDLTFTAIPSAESAQVLRWTGGAGNNHFAAAANWSANRVPQTGDVLLFIQSGDYVNDLPAGTSLSNVLFAAAGATCISGNALALVNAENYGAGRVAFACDVSCAGDFEPRVGGGLAFDGALAVTGVFAPQQGAVEINGAAQANSFSLGNAGAYEKRPADFGHPASVYYRRGGAGTLTANSFGADGFLLLEALRFEGTNAFTGCFRASDGLLLAVTNGVTAFGDVEPPIGSSVRVRVFADAQLHLTAFENRYRANVSFVGPGRLSFGADGLWARPELVFTNVVFATRGSDYAIAGDWKLGGATTVDARDPDGTARTITLGAAVSAGADATLALAGGCVSCAYGSRFDVPVAFTGAALALPRRLGRAAVFSAPSITGAPTAVVQADGAECRCEIVSDANGQTLYVRRIYKGCAMILR